jgi:hypothetical protein
MYRCAASLMHRFDSIAHHHSHSHVPNSGEFCSAAAAAEPASSSITAAAAALSSTSSSAAATAVA